MASTSIAYLVVLILSMASSLIYHPMVGMIAYICIYNLGSLNKWWGKPLYDYGIRDSQFMYVTVLLSYFLKPSKIEFKLFNIDKQEWLLIIFLMLLWASTVIGLDNYGDYYNVFKITKVVVIIIFASHIITDVKKVEIFFWALIICNIYMGYNAYFAPHWMFTNNRLNFGIGSVDFSESNFLAAHMVMMIPITGVVFIKSRLFGKLLCMVNAALTLNTLVLLRSRGSFLAAIVAFFIAIFLAEKKYRLLIISGALLTGIVFFSLTDTFFWNRISTIEAEGQNRDSSAEGRLVFWGVAWQMAEDHPLGIGADNFKKYIVQYSPHSKGRDTHSTYFRCLAEIGFQGLFVLLYLIYNSFKILFRIRKDTSDDEDHIRIRLYAYGITVALASYLIAGMFITMTYIEEFYWMLLIPLFLKRALIIADISQDTAEQNT